MKTIYFIFFNIIIFISSITAQQTSLDGEFEVVFENKTLQFNSPPSTKSISGYKDQSIIFACQNPTTNNTFSIYQSKNQGDSWVLLAEGKADSTFKRVGSIVQPSPNNICMIIEGFVRDSAQNWISNFWVWSSDDLGKTWVRHNAGGLPLGFYFEDNKGVFASTTNDTAILWTTIDYGLNWSKHQLPKGLENTAPAMLGEKEFMFFNNTNDGINKDSLLYTSNIELNLWESKKLNKNFGYNNFIVLNRNRILSAFPVPSNIGTTALSYILETNDRGDSWKTPVNNYEDSVHARSGLYDNSILDSNNMAFLGPNVLYFTTNSGNSWERAIWEDSVNNGTRGAYLFYNSKINRRQLIITIFGITILRYTIPGAVGIKESFLSNKELELYPNPVKNTLYINLDQSEKIIGDVIVWSIEGKEVIRKSFNNKSIKELNVEGLKSGVYIIKLETVNGSYSNRFVK